MVDHVNMKVAKILMCILGLWPVKMTGFKLRLYKIYQFISLHYYILYDVTQTLQAIKLIGEENWLDMCVNLGVTIVFLLNIYKVRICKSKAIASLLAEIEETEKETLQSKDKVELLHHKNHVQLSYRVSFLFFSIGFSGICTYFIRPLATNFFGTIPYNNITGEYQKALIFSSWFPFNPNKHYISAYLIQLAGGFYGAGYTITGGILFFGIIIFAVGQIRILQHRLRNFHKFAQEYAKFHNLSFETGQRMYLKKCILEHQRIIKFINSLDKSLRTYALIDFGVSSFQLTSLVYQILMKPGFDVEKVSVILYFLTMTVQLFVFYWSGHEVIEQSMNIGHAVFDCEWRELTKDVKEAFVFIILRAQKPICLNIGPIYPMRVELLLNIYKALYSCVAVIMK